jgi:hypothetical protein
MIYEVFKFPELEKYTKKKKKKKKKKKIKFFFFFFFLFKKKKKKKKEKKWLPNTSLSLILHHLYIHVVDIFQRMG